jgi:hypothetical protein
MFRGDFMFAADFEGAWNELRSLRATTCIPSTGGDYLPGGRYYASQDGEADGPMGPSFS